MSLQSIVRCTVVSFALSMAVAASGQEVKPVKITVYADSVVNADYFRVFLVDKLIRNHEAIDVISMPELRDMLTSSEYRKVKLMTTSGREISHGEYGIENDKIRVGRREPVALADVQSLVFLEKRDFAGAVIFGALNFLVAGGIAAVVEVVEKEKGLEFQSEKALTYGGAFGLLGFLTVFTTTKENTVYFAFTVPVMRGH